MYQNKRRIRLIYFIIDVFFIIFSFYLPYKFNPTLVPPTLLEARSYLFVFAFWGITLIFLLNNFHLYFTDRGLSIITEWWKVARCVFFSTVLTVLFLFGLKIVIFSRIVFTEITLLLLLSLSIWRTAKRIYVRHLIQNGYSNYNILIIGAGRIGLALLEEIKMHPYLGIRIAGFLDDARTGEVGGFKVLGKIKDLDDIVRKNFIDEIYVTIPSERKLTSEIITKGAKLGKSVRIAADFFDLPHRQVGLNYIGIVPLITYFERGLHGSEQLIKRFTDILISGLALMALLPFLSMVVFLIKLESPGPVFYVAKRYGKKGRIFNFYKLRSMVDNADTHKGALRHKSEVKGPIFKIKNDPRITKIGKFLRKYSLDEIPQLINVLKGDMSLVGPRPFPVDESEEIKRNDASRFNIKPGITGLAQVKGRSDLSFNHWARWDNWYINHWSFGLDLRILLWTIPAVLKKKGAY